MDYANTRQQWVIERWSPTLFVLAGLSVLVVLVASVSNWMLGLAIPQATYWPLFPFGIGLALVGLAGLYPRVADSSRRFALAGLALAVFGAMGLLGGAATLVIAAPPGPYPDTLGLLGAPIFLGLVAFVGTCSVYGIALLRTGTGSRRTGAGILAIAGLQFGEVLAREALVAVARTTAVTQHDLFVSFEVITYGLIVAVLLLLGYSLRTDTRLTTRSDSLGTTG